MRTNYVAVAAVLATTACTLGSPVNLAMMKQQGFVSVAPSAQDPHVISVTMQNTYDLTGLFDLEKPEDRKTLAIAAVKDQCANPRIISEHAAGSPPVGNGLRPTRYFTLNVHCDDGDMTKM